MNSFNKQGLISFLINSKDLIQQAPDDATFFRSLGFVLKTILANTQAKVILDSLLKERTKVELEYKEVTERSLNYFLDILKKLKSHNKFPSEDLEILAEEKLLLKRKSGELQSSEPFVLTAYLAILKILERLDNRGLIEITKPWKIDDPDSLIRYKINDQKERYLLAKEKFDEEWKSTPWGAYSNLLLIPQLLFESNEYSEMTKEARDDFKQTPTFETSQKYWELLNFMGVLGEMRGILKGNFNKKDNYPIILKREVFLHHYLFLRTYLLSVLQGMNFDTYIFDERHVDLVVPGLFKIITRNNTVIYIGSSGKENHTYTIKIPEYVLIKELAKADNYTLSIDVMVKNFKDLSKCESPPDPDQSDNYVIVKYTAQAIRKRFGITPKEIGINRKNRVVFFMPPAKKK